MTLGNAWGEDGLSYSGKDMRQQDAFLIDRGDSLVSGVMSGLKVTEQTSPGSTVKVAAGRAVLAATQAGKTGAYGVYNDASDNSPTVAPTSTNGRIDRLIIRVASGVAAFEVVQGTPAGSPAEPSITGDNYLELAKITLPGSTTNVTNAMLTDRRVFRGEWARPWGVVGYSDTSGLADQSLSSAPASVSGLSVTWVAVANRRYEIEARLQNTANSSGANPTVEWGIDDGAGNIKRRTTEFYDDVNVGEERHIFLLGHTEKLSLAGSTTRRVQMLSSTGTPIIVAGGATTAAHYCDLTVRDVGPLTNPD